MTKPETEKLPELPAHAVEAEITWRGSLFATLKQDDMRDSVGTLYTADQMREMYRQGWMDGSSDTIALTTPDAAPDAVELKRLRDIEHYTWHLLDNAEDDGTNLTIDLEISRRDLGKLNELLPESHPEVAHARSAGGAE